MRMRRLLQSALTMFLALATLEGQAAPIDFSFEEQRDLPLVFVNVVVRSGAVSDPKGKSGLTNFLGEAMIRGTRKLNKEQLDLALDQIGARIAVDTRQEAMIFRGAVLSRELDTFLGLLKDILTEPRFDPREIEKLRAEFVSGLLEELGQDRVIAAKQFQRFFFGSHPYANYVMGKAGDLRSITRKDLRSQFKRIFTRNNVFMVGSGDSQEGRIKDWFTQVAAKYDAGEPSPDLRKPELQKGKRLLIVDKPDRTQTQIYVGEPGISIKDPRYFAFYIGNNAFGGGGFTSRLMKEVRVKRGWSYGASSSMSSGTQPKAWATFLFPAEKDTPQALSLVLSMIDDLKKSGLSEEEFEFSKKSLINSSGFMYNTPKKRSENRITEKILSLPEGFMSSFGSRLSSVQRDDTNRALSEVLHPEDNTIVVLGTAKRLRDALARSAGIDTSKIAVIRYDQD